MTRQTQERLQTAREQLTDKADQLEALEDDLENDVKTMMEQWDGAAADIETVDVSLEKTDITVDEPSLVWMRV